MLEFEKKNQYNFTDAKLNSDASLLVVSDPIVTYVYKTHIDEEGYLRLIRIKKSLPPARWIEVLKSSVFLIGFRNEVYKVNVYEESVDI